jgi:hypothetical protein
MCCIILGYLCITRQVKIARGICLIVVMEERSDQVSMKIVKPSEKDKKLAQKYPLSKAQVAICRDHFELIFIQYYG